MIYILLAVNRLLDPSEEPSEIVDFWGKTRVSQHNNTQDQSLRVARETIVGAVSVLCVFCSFIILGPLLLFCAYTVLHGRKTAWNWLFLSLL